MPVEIRELVIKTVLEPEKREQEAPSTPSEVPESATSPDDMERLIQRCVKEVLRILKQEKER